MGINTDAISDLIADIDASYKRGFQAGADAARRECAGIAESMRPAGGRMWTDEQHACFAALTDCAAAILERVGKAVED